MTRPYTVRELAEKLLSLPEEVQDYPVATEGCDCFGDTGSLDIRKDGTGKFVLIERACEIETEEDRPKQYEPSEEEIEYRAKGLLPE